MSAESDLPTHADFADQWFSLAEVHKELNPDAVRDRIFEHQYHLGALMGRSASDPLTIDLIGRLYGPQRDKGVAELLVAQIFQLAEAEFKLAVDPLTGIRTHQEYERWAEGVFRLRGSDEKRHPSKNEPRPRWYGKIKGDLDNFKQINDELSEEVGDEVLTAAAQEMTGNVRRSDNLIVYRERTKGDEFGIAVADIPYEQAEGMWSRLQKMQISKVQEDRRQQIWQAIRDAKAACPNPDNDPKAYRKYLEVKDVVTSIRGEKLRVTWRKLFINGTPICNVGDLAVIDFGFAHGEVKNAASLKEINEAADIHKAKVKGETHTAVGGAYRDTEMT